MAEGIELKPLGASAPPPPPRHPDSAPGSLGKAYRSAEEKAKAIIHLQQDAGLDAISVWALVLSSWFAILAVPLLLFPRILIFFSQTPPPTVPFSSSSVANAAAAARENHYDSLTPLEYTLCLSLSLGLIAMSLVSLFILVPTYTPPSVNPSRTPLLGVLVGLTTISGAVLWNAGGLGGLGVFVGGGNVFVAVWGWWVIVFGGGRGRITKKQHKPNTPERLRKL
ncbi:hypothetical protein C349_01219 [Cryptococcus neoformans var. grubii Br795]|uniref:Uncharacterized protein n=1 Tax=Cryptococcus neoformans Tu259-1 TaxID=1230072 RepID=A0A854QGF3_CRYNE|nr:hypothetical protein C368_01629 [Cryptococcus neoformans var. grubii 125.91]OXG27312.1 hypothetical protein C361_01114 [Cryptococcus neoformans var. grubii Tu259-1]OXG53213.1 hypothetical protein C355_01190 [Cryptococcus neoformans var. grubii Th84]OXG86481.1 hypothetical protein C350_01128 [Cryptococcus neoformans var. grubii MW-RSA36]OXG87931.1 hypothetical protein C349_01219 [Cryptococcus neoformans var. grubii Br795]OXH16833.1 hypothetical protein J010_01099 [Cryptococcus neoformans var